MGTSQTGSKSSSSGGTNGHPRIVANYPYTDEAGCFLFETVRLEPKDFRQRRRNGKGGWIWDLAGVPRVLYCLPDLLNAPNDQPVFVVEGEKDVDRLRSFGWTATCNPMGAGKWRDDYNQAFRGRHVFILADNDGAGRQHARGVERHLRGIAASIFVVELPDLPPKGDVSDWLDAHGNDAVQLLEVIKELSRRRDNSTAAATNVSVESTLNEIDAGELAAQSSELELNYLTLLGQDGYLVKGWSHLIAGYPRCGKTDLLVACCREWLAAGERILYLTEEPISIWQHRLVRTPGPWAGMRLVFGLGADPLALRARAGAGTESIVIVDAIRNLGLIGSDESDNAALARQLSPWVASTRQRDKTLILNHHDRKGGGEHGEAIAGGHALLGIVDIALEVRYDSFAKNRRLIKALARVIQPPELLYERQEDGTLKALGTPESVSLAEVRRRVLTALDADWLKTSEVWERLSDPRPSLDQTRKALTVEAEAGRVERDPPWGQDAARKTCRWRLLPTSPN